MNGITTPNAKECIRKNLDQHNELSPFVIPPSPMMLKLGSGTGVSVYRLKRGNNSIGSSIKSPWAVKKVNNKSKSNISHRLAVEASILRHLDHPNIVGFRALTGTSQGDLCLAMEDCEKSLMDLIEEREYLEETFTQQEVLKVAWGVANGLNYLHNEFKLLHGDIKSGNILVRGDFEAVKICDFGVSVKLKDDFTGLKNPKDRYIGSEPWKAKEVLNQKNGAAITDKADIFAYGLVIWEMLTLKVPHVDLLDSDDSNLSTDDEPEDTEEYLAALGTRPPLPEKDFDESFAPLLELFVCCTQEDPNSRPNAAQIVQALKLHAQMIVDDTEI